MSDQIIHDFTAAHLKPANELPALRSGMTVRVHHKIIEGSKERTQIFEGVIIKLSSGSGLSKTVTVRKVVEGIGVEKVFPVHSPVIAKIEVVKSGKVRRAKLYFMRGRSGKSAKLYDKKKVRKEEEVSA